MTNNKSKKKGSLIKRFIGNKNTVTILGFVACIATLIIGYNIRVNKAISPISLPYAKQSIPAKTLITNDMVGKIKVASTYVSDATNLVTSSKEVVGKYASYKSNIPKGSLFYSTYLKTAEEMPDSAFANIEEGYTIFSLPVDDEKTLSNSIRAGDYIDLYMSATSQDGDEALTMFGCLIRSIRVLAVKDDNGDNILKNSLTYGSPTELLFAVDDDMFKLLMASQWVDGDVDIVPVIYNPNYTSDPNETSTTQELVDYILAQTAEFGE